MSNWSWMKWLKEKETKTQKDHCWPNSPKTQIWSRLKKGFLTKTVSHHLFQVISGKEFGSGQDLIFDFFVNPIVYVWGCSSAWGKGFIA